MSEHRIHHPSYSNSHQRCFRPLATLNRMHWDNVINDPSSYAVVLNDRGSATQHTYLLDVARFMDTLVSNLSFAIQTVGKETERGFLLLTWKSIAEKMGVAEWRVKQCAKFAFNRDWITSNQPKDKDENGEWVNRASIKSVTNQYFKDLGLTDALKDAKKSALAYVVEKAKKWNLPVGFILTPISMLYKIANSLTELFGSKAVKAVGNDGWHRWFAKQEQT